MSADALLRMVFRADVLGMQAYAVPSVPSGAIKLDAMENPYGLPAALAASLAERLAGVALNRYPPGDLSAFRAQLAAAFDVPEGAGLILGNGSDELIHLLIQACAQPGACVMAPWPSFTMYRISAQLNGVGFIGVPLRADLQVDLDAMLQAIRTHRPSIIFLSYPNNPTGLLPDDQMVQGILEAAPGLVVVDEAYQPFAQQTWLPRLLSDPRLLVLRTVSKLGLAGVRLGYLCGTPAITQQVDKVRPPYNVNVLTLETVRFLLQHQSVFHEQAAGICAERRRLTDALSGIPQITVYPSAANFLLFRLPAPWRASDVNVGLKRHGVLVKDVSGMDPCLNNCLRVTVGTPAENDAFMAAMRVTIDELHVAASA